AGTPVSSANACACAEGGNDAGTPVSSEYACECASGGNDAGTPVSSEYACECASGGNDAGTPVSSEYACPWSNVAKSDALAPCRVSASSARCASTAYAAVPKRSLGDSSSSSPIVSPSQSSPSTGNTAESNVVDDP